MLPCPKDSSIFHDKEEGRVCCGCIVVSAEMEAPRPRDAKRVRFSYEEPDPGDDDDDDDEQNRPRKLKFPKRKKDSSDVDLDEEADGPILSKDARVAATERALRRTVMDEQLRSAEDTSNISDVTEAELQYADVEDDHGIKLEPFNLDAERKDGYFDDDGHYVEYETKYEARDAWLDSVEVDTRFAEKHFVQAAKEESETDLSPEEIARMKKRIADVLQPGETVLEALRRLKGSSKDGNRREKLTGAAKITFDQLTEDAMKLMDHGETDVYDKVQEKFQREADAALPKQTKDSFDIFGDEPDDGGFVAEEGFAAAEPQFTAEDTNYPGYVYDAASGYYFNADVGYFYDPNTGFYCSASSGQWYKFDDESNTYVEAV